MSLETVPAEVTTPVAETTAPADDTLSLSSFEAKYSGEPSSATDTAAAVAEPEPATETPSRRQTKRQDWKTLRAKTTELTRRLRETEAERDALKGSGTPPPAAAIAPTASAGAPAAVQPVARIAAPSAKADPEPTYEVDPSTGKPYDDLNKWMRDHGLWAGREALRQRDTEIETRTREQQQATEVERLSTQWTSSVAASKAKYPDFEVVAFAPTRIPHGSLVDAWVREHKVGTELLYHLQKHPTELDAMLALPLFDQVEALTLLAQRLSGSRMPAVSTGAATTPIAQPVSRPPTPVRTGPIAPANQPPDPDQASLSSHEQFYGSGRRRA